MLSLPTYLHKYCCHKILYKFFISIIFSVEIKLKYNGKKTIYTAIAETENM